MAADYLDNIQILKAIDERQQQTDGSPLHISAWQLLADLTGVCAPDPQLTPGFLQELAVARDAEHLTWRLTDQGANLRDASQYLHQIWDLALTARGQDRARNRVVVLPPPDPGEDDGHDLILRQAGEAISRGTRPIRSSPSWRSRGCRRTGCNCPPGLSPRTPGRSWPPPGAQGPSDAASSGASSAGGWTAS
jgi:hypothetical protein